MEISSSLNDFPDEILLEIFFQFIIVTGQNSSSIRLCCHKWNKLIKDKFMSFCFQKLKSDPKQFVSYLQKCTDDLNKQTDHTTKTNRNKELLMLTLILVVWRFTDLLCDVKKEI